MIKEACVETLKQAIRAEQYGADQIELCGQLDLDGLTPDKMLIKEVLDQLAIPVKVMIRPHANGFAYTPAEIQQMIRDIKQFKKMPIHGFVFGVLTADLEIDEHATRVLAQTARPFPITFHKAIDAVPDLVNACTILEDIPGITHILTSGGAASAQEGVTTS